jgi:hypothetical protein
MGARILSKGLAAARLLESAPMRWTVVVPGALLPSPIAAEVLAAATAPWLKAVLARAQAAAAERIDGGAPHLRWLWRRFGGSGEAITAPYALRALAPESDPNLQSWHIDPVHFAFARDHALVAPLDAPPTGAETDLLASHLRSALDEIGIAATLHLHADRWLLSLAEQWSLQTTPLDAALGQSALEHWPAGDDAAVWRRLLTEVQMRWHAEPTNDAREAAGQAAVNGLWLHGGGRWQPLPRQPYGAVTGSDPVLRGWALASGVAAAALYEDSAVPPMPTDVLSIRRDLLQAAQFEAWGQWIEKLAALDQELHRLHDACLAAGGRELELVLAGKQQVRVVPLRRGDSWRLWRNAPIAPLLAEAA